jgi:DNA topoisomerase-1
MNVVVVESPAKAKTINKYLGPDFKVLASFGHVRDLPSKDGSVRPEEDFAMSWSVDGRGQKQVKEIADAVKGADHLYLATDPDREGEAISWHVLDVLKQKGALKDVDVKRVVFNEITKDAVLDAIANPRDVDQDLVDAYLARRALDYLVGFTLSPVLWRKLPGSRSAGRVQSVALRLICEREAEIEAFKPQEYWSVEADFATPREEDFTARLTHLDGEKLERLSLGDKGRADTAVAAIENADFTVASVERKEVKRNPAPPFTTSTLQQEASRKLGFGASRTMRIAQQLYEGVNIGGETVGLITYMRTDSVTLSGEAIAGCRRLIESQYGADYLPPSPRVYKTKAKNAQEAHEAVRPTDLFRRPEQMRAYLDDDQKKLYELIWKRTVACEMASAVMDRVTVDLGSSDGRTTLRATGQVI